LFSIRSPNARLCADLDAQRLTEKPLEGAGVARRRPKLELGVSRCSELQELVLTPVMQLQPGNWLGMAAVEAFGQTEDRGQRSNRHASSPPECAVAIVTPLRRRLAVVPGDECDGVDFVRLESP